jgi:hypothetical protein
VLVGMESVDNTPSGLVLISLLVGALAVAGGLAVYWMIRRRRSRSLLNRLRQRAQDLLTGVLLPDAEGGHIHLEYVLLTQQDILVLDYREVAGHVFGSDSMQEWTVLGSNRRDTFANPLPLLYDRVAAVRRIVPDVPVRGLIAFSSGAQFSKGFPPDVVMLDDLLAALQAPPVTVAADEAGQRALASAWVTLRNTARPDT